MEQHWILPVATLLLVGISFVFLYRFSRVLGDLHTRFSDFVQLNHLVSTRIEDRSNQLEARLQTFCLDVEKMLSQARQEAGDRYALQTAKQQENLTQGLSQLHQQLHQGLLSHAESLRNNTEQLVKMVRESLQYITGEVNKRLSDGFEKTTATFTEIVKRLALIDEAQKKITELSGNVVSLQEILTDKRSRGAFGEVQLSALVTNMVPEQHFSFQHTLSNGKRADCVLFLPAPTGTIAIDSKFPLENYQRFTDFSLPEHERKAAEQLFKQDIKKHIQDIANKYIIANETADGAMMFIPAEAVFASIHAQHPDLVEAAHRARVWMVSPTTLMAVLTTVRAVIKDEATRQQVHIIQQHLVALARDFTRFQIRMDNLSKHVNQVHTDVEEIQTSAKKMTSRFQKIEGVQLDGVKMDAIPEEI